MAERFVMIPLKDVEALRSDYEKLCAFLTEGIEHNICYADAEDFSNIIHVLWKICFKNYEEVVK